jgi:aerobic-type carbon monoxide dehydrogenase small subunit (CoxS/CutS family)
MIPRMSTYTLRINGTERRITAAADTPLLWILRDTLALTGTKFGCGVGVCGACTVHAGGQPVKACLLPVSAAQGADVRTIEGLVAHGEHPVQRAWLEEDVAQCGYCQPAMILRAAALLAAHPDPSDAQIDQAMDEVLCRCGSYPRIRRAIRRAAESARAR